MADLFIRARFTSFGAYLAHSTLHLARSTVLLAFIACQPGGGPEGEPADCSDETSVGCACAESLECSGDLVCLDGACATPPESGDGDGEIGDGGGDAPPLLTCNPDGRVGDLDEDSVNCDQHINTFPGPLTVLDCDDTLLPLAYANAISGDVLVSLGDSNVGVFVFPRCIHKVGGPDDDGRIVVKDSPRLRYFQTQGWIAPVIGDFDIEMGQRGPGTGATIGEREMTGTLNFTGSVLSAYLNGVGAGVFINDASDVVFHSLTTTPAFVITSTQLDSLSLEHLATVGVLELELSTSPIQTMFLPRLIEATSITIEAESLWVLGLQLLERFEVLTVIAGPELIDFSLPALEEGGHVHIEGTGACTSTLEVMLGEAVTDGRLTTFSLVDNSDC